MHSTMEEHLNPKCQSVCCCFWETALKNEEMSRPKLWIASLHRSGLRTTQTPPAGKSRLYPWRLPQDSLRCGVRGHFMPGDTARWADVVTVLLRMLNLRELNRL